MKKLTLDELKQRLLIINKDIEILDKAYVSSDTHLNCKCRVCNNEWMVKWDNLKQGRACPNCASKNKGVASRVSLEHARNIYSELNKDVELNNQHIINGESWFQCKCNACGRSWNSSWNNLKTGRGCIICNNSQLSIEVVKERLYAINKNIMILDNYYTNNYTHMNCVCMLDGYTWKVTWASLQQKVGCPECARLNKSGENNHLWNSSLTDEDRQRRRLYKNGSDWRNSVLKRENYTCEICGIKGATLNAHHKDAYHWCKDRRGDISNGACLCEDCHFLFHKLYGNKNNTEQQWIQFYELNKTV